MAKYKVILNPINDPKAKQAVAKKLVAITKKPAPFIAKVVENAPVVIIKSLDEVNAKKMKQVFGDYITVKAIGGPAPKPAPKPSPPPAAKAPQPQPATPSLGFDDEEPAEAGASPLGFDDEPTPPPPPKAPPAAAPARESSSLSFQDSAPEPAAPKAPPKPSPTPAASSAQPSRLSTGGTKNFKETYKDLSDENGYAYEFFCERCDKSYRPDYFNKPSGMGYNMVTFFKFVGKKLSGKMPHDLNEMKRLEDRAFQRSSFNKSIQLAEEHFLKCTECGKRVCGSCWNTSQKKCADCAPLKTEDLPEYMRKKLEKEKREKEAKAKSRFCANCGAEKVEGAKFCEVCGASYE